MKPHCKIGLVRLKAHPEVAVLSGPRLDGMAERFISNAKTIAGYFPDNMAGFVMVAWNDFGSFSRGVRFLGSSPVKFTMMPSFVADILRRDIARDVINEEVFERKPEG